MRALESTAAATQAVEKEANSIEDNDEGDDIDVEEEESVASRAAAWI